MEKATHNIEKSEAQQHRTISPKTVIIPLTAIFSAVLLNTIIPVESFILQVFIVIIIGSCSTAIALFIESKTRHSDETSTK